MIFRSTFIPSWANDKFTDHPFMRQRAFVGEMKNHFLPYLNFDGLQCKPEAAHRQKKERLPLLRSPDFGAPGSGKRMERFFAGRFVYPIHPSLKKGAFHV